MSRFWTPEPGGRILLAAFVVLAALVSIPIIAVWLPPILDYPNHLARMYVLTALPGSPDLTRFYALAWAAIPDLAMDVAVPWLTKLMPVETASRLFLAILLLGAAGGCVALHRALFRRWSLWPLCAFLLLYNRMLLWGFLNYLAGVALALWGLAAWVALERQPVALRIVAGALFATAIYLAHLAAFGAYAVALLAFAAAAERFAIRTMLDRIIPALATLAPPALLFLASPTSSAPGAIGYGNILRKFDLPVSIFDNYSRPFDGATFAILLIAVIVGLARGGLTIHRRFRWSVIALILVFLAMPSRFLSASGIDHRLPVAIAFLFVAGTDWTRLTAEWRARVGVALLALFIVRLTIVGDVWIDADRQYRALVAIFDQIPRGAKVAVASPAADVRAGGAPLLHFPTLAVGKRDAFVPTLFADPAQHPMRFTPEAATLAAAAAPANLWQAIRDGSLPVLPGYDELMIVDPPRPFDAALLSGRILFDAPRLLLVRLGNRDRAVQP